MKRKKRNRRKLGRKRRSSPVGRAPRTAKQYFARSKQFQDTWNRVVNVVSKMRADGVSLRRASREAEVNPQTVIQLASSALRKRRNGRYVAKDRDRLLRVLLIPTPKGPREIAVKSSRKASQLGAYWAAVHRYLETGDSSAILSFRGKHITATGRRKFLLLTNLDKLDRLAGAGVLSFESLYARSA